MAVLVLAFNPSVTHAGFVGTNMIQIDGAFADWTNNVYSITNASPLYTKAWDLDAYWMAMSTANGTSPASSSNRIQNVYYRLDVGGNPGATAYWIQMNLGVAPPGYADHIMQIYPNASGTPAVSLTLFQFITNSTTPYPSVAVFTVKGAQVVAKVSNDSTISGAVIDTNATGAFAANGTNGGYSIEIKLPIGWFTNTTYGGAIKDDGTGPAFVETALFSATGSKGAVGTPKDQIVDASGNQYFCQQSTTTGAATFTANHTGGYAFSVGAAAATLTPVAGASDSITLTVNQNNGGTIVTDTTYTNAHNVTISGFTASPNGSYGSLNGTALTGSSVTISVTFASGVATIPLILDNAAAQNILFSISGLTVPDANNLSITPTAGTANAYRITAASGTPTAGASDALTITLVDQFGNTETGFNGDKTLTFSGLATADDGTHPTVTDKTGSAVSLGTSELITFASGVSSSASGAAVLKAYKAEGPVTLNVLDSGGLSSASTGGAGVSLTMANAIPVATTHSFTRAPSASLKILQTDLLAGAADANHDNISLSSVQSPSGDATVTAPAGLYVFYSPGTNGDGATFTYTVSDGHSGTDTKTVTINVVKPGGIAQAISYNAGGVTIRFAGIPGISYDVQRSATSDFASFSTQLTTNAPPAGVFSYTDSSPLNLTGFYRLMQH
jgi:adhesin/invasin